MNTARAEILGRVRNALANADRGMVAVARDYRSGASTADPVALFIDRVTDYRAVVERCDASEAEARIAAALPTGGRVVVPVGLPWTVAGAVVDDRFPPSALDQFDATVTAATLAVAETGTIVLTHDTTQGRRAISLVPDLHVCVVLANQVVADVPDAIARLDGRAVTTWISGPSATSDIELNRVEGVHGPRRLHVIVLDDMRQDD